MSDKHLQTRKSLTVQTAVFGGSTIALGFSAAKVIGTLFTVGIGAVLGTFSFYTLLAFIFFSIPMFRGAFKAFSDLDYSKANQKGWLGSLSALALVILDFII
jgi:hypothetical protein